MIIYLTTNIKNGKIYVGQDSKNDPKYLGSGLLLQRSIQKYGVEVFTKTVLEECSSKEELDDREKYWISYYNATDLNIGYNIANGGQGGYLCANCPDKLRGENYYLNTMSEEDREVHLNTFRRGMNYWRSKGFKTLDEIELYISENYCGANHSHRKYKTEDEYQQWLDDTRRGDNFWLNNVDSEVRNQYIEDHYKGKNNPIFRGKTEDEIEQWLDDNRRGSNAPNAKYRYEIDTGSEVITTACLKTLCKERDFNLHIIRKLIEVTEGIRKSYTPRDQKYRNWKCSKNKP